MARVRHGDRAGGRGLGEARAPECGRGRCRPSGCSGYSSGGSRRGSRPVSSSRSTWRWLVAHVSVYRVGAAGADPVHVFGDEARALDLRHAAWLGQLPLELVAFAGPGVALAADRWLTAPSGRSQGPGHVVAGDLVTAQDAAGELIARGESGLNAYTRRSGDVSSDGPLWASSVGLLVADGSGGERRSAPPCSRGVGRLRWRGRAGAVGSGRLSEQPLQRLAGVAALRSGRAGSAGAAISTSSAA